MSNPFLSGLLKVFNHTGFSLEDLKELAAAQKELKKPYIEGSGPFKDRMGQPSISDSTIYRRWKTSRTYQLTFAALSWNIIGGIILLISLDNALPLSHSPNEFLSEVLHVNLNMVPFLVFPLLGIFLAYLALTHWVNRTEVSVEESHIRVRRGPLPCFSGQIEIPKSTVHQIFVDRQYGESNGRRVPDLFSVYAITNQGNLICIDSGLPNYPAARILEQWLENRLGITDEIMPGEYGT